MCVCTCICNNNYIRTCKLLMQQYRLLPYCVLPLSVLQYIAVLQYMIKFEKEHIMSLKLVFSSKGYGTALR